nr:MAG TPA: hypothetical protein [Caudoviricetes sp.]
MRQHLHGKPTRPSTIQVKEQCYYNLLDQQNQGGIFYEILHYLHNS